MCLRSLRHRLLPLKSRRGRKRLLLLWLRMLRVGWIVVRKIVKYILLAFTLTEQFRWITVLHLILMKGSNLHLYWVFPLLFLEWTSFLLKLNFNGLRMRVGSSIRVILLLFMKSSLMSLLLFPKIKAILVASKLFFMCRTRGLSLWLMKIEVKILAKFGWLSLS